MKNFLLSLRLALSLHFAFVMLVVIGVMAYAQYRSAQAMSESKAESFVRSSNAQAQADLNLILSVPFWLQKMSADHIAEANLYRPGDMQAVEQYLRRTFINIYANGTGNVDMLQMGSENGDFTAISHKRNRAERRMVFTKDQRTSGHLLVSDDETGIVSQTLETYDPRKRPWYEPAAKLLAPRWTPIYTASTDAFGVGISATTPVLSTKPDAAGKRRLLGVLGSDIKLSSLTDVLRKAPLQSQVRSALTYIVDDRGQLVALSNNDPLIAAPADGDPPQLVQAAISKNPLVSRSFAAMSSGAVGEDVAHLLIGDVSYSVFVSRFVDPRGLDWRLVSVASEDELKSSFERDAHISLALALGASTLGLMVGLVLVRRAVEPIRQTARQAKALATVETMDEAAFLSPITSRIEEAAQLTEAFQFMSQRIVKQVSRLKEMALRDEVTGLLNRRGMIAGAIWADPQPAMLVMLRIDNYEAVTAMMRSSSNDALLKAVAGLLCTVSPHALMIARETGAQFLLLFRGLSEAQHGPTVDALKRAFDMPLSTDADALVLDEVSMGIASGICTGDEIDTRLHPECRLALLEARRRGNTQTVFFEPAMGAEASTANALQRDLHAAVEDGQFQLHFQPIVRLDSGKVIGLEALVRWPHPTRGMVSPGLFIPLAEESGAIIRLGTWILREACSQVTQLTRDLALPDNFFVNVNVSVRQLMQSDFVTVVKDAIVHSGIAAGQIKLEITESLPLHESVTTQSAIAALQSLGIKLALDDFGTGYSSLSYLNRVGFHTVKIDRSLLLAAQRSPAGKAILQSALHLTQGLRAQCVVEGVEDREQAEILIEVGVLYAQGYLFARPAPLADLLPMLQSPS